MPGPTRKARKAPSPRRRMSAEDREAQIVAEAIRFFAEVGLQGQTRELADRLGITQPLLFRYFPTKQDLIERVYYELFEKPWRKSWRSDLTDRAVPIRDRLIAYYDDYTKVLFSYEWMRIYMYAGLEGAAVNRKYIKRLEQQILRTICREIRAAHAVANEEAGPITALELEAVWSLHGGVIYYGVRKYIYQIRVPASLTRIIEEVVDTMLESVPRTLRSLRGKHGRSLG